MFGIFKNKETIDLDSYGENVAAIAAVFHENQSRYEKIYEKHKGGFVGIWSLCAQAGKIFSSYERNFKAGEDFNWIEAIDHYAQAIITAMLDGLSPNSKEMAWLAEDAIEASAIVKGRG